MKAALEKGYPALVKAEDDKKKTQKPKFAANDEDRNLSLAEQLQRKSSNLKSVPSAKPTGKTLDATFADMLKAQLKTLKSVDCDEVGEAKLAQIKSTPLLNSARPSGVSTPGSNSRASIANQIAFHMLTGGRRTSMKASRKIGSMTLPNIEPLNLESDDSVSDNEPSATDSD